MNITTCSFICYLPSTLIIWLSESIGLVKQGMIRVVMYNIYDSVKEHASVILKLRLLLLKLIYSFLKLYVNSLSRTKYPVSCMGQMDWLKWLLQLSYWTNSIILLFLKFCILIPLLYRCYGYLNWMVKLNEKVYYRVSRYCFSYFISNISSSKWSLVYKIIKFVKYVWILNLWNNWKVTKTKQSR